MKKTYLKPSTVTVSTELVTIVCQSGGDVSSDKGIGYGGVDEEGSLDPASRRRRDVWEDVGDEEYCDF